MFELTIKCTKDIKNLHIDFVDGTMICTETTEPVKSAAKSEAPARKTQQNKPIKVPVEKSTPFHDEYDAGPDSFSAMHKPTKVQQQQRVDVDELVPSIEDRPVKVASDLHDLSI